MSRLKIWDMVTSTWQYAGTVDPAALAADPAFRNALASDPLLIAALQGSLIPAATVWPTGAAVADPGWILLDGSAIPNAQSLYPSLWGRIPAAWKSGTTLLVPDMRGRTIIGAGTGAGLTARTLATALGTETHALTAAQTPVKAHGHGHYISASSSGSSTNTDTNHYHLIGGVTGNANQGHRHGTAVVEYYAYVSSGPSTTVAGNGGSITLYLTYAASTGYDIDVHAHNNAANTNWQSAGGGGAAAYTHNHPISVSTSIAGGIYDAADGAAGAGHPNVQPSYVLNWQMKVH